MGKKKKQKKSVNKHKIDKILKHKKDLEKIYTDKFIQTEVSLAPSAFDIYKEKEVANPIVLKANSDLELGDEIYEAPTEVKFLESSTEKYRKKIKNSIGDLDSERKESILSDILAKIEVEKNEFESSLKAKTKESESNIVDADVADISKKDKIFSKIYDAEFVDSFKQKTILSSIWKVFSSDIVWQAIAGAMILGVVLFYFQGLQPAVLNNYATSAKKQINFVSQEYTNQAQQYFDVQKNILEEFTYQPQLLCSQVPLYANFNKDVTDLTSLKNNLFPNAKYSKLEDKSNFWENKILNQYNTVYSSYTQKVKKYQQSTSDLLQLVKFNEYKNSWHKLCASIEANSKDPIVLNKSCTDLLNTSDNFLKEKDQFTFWSQIEADITTGLALCQAGINSGNLKDFLKNWLISYNKMASFTPDLVKINEDLVNLNRAFEDDVNNSITIINQVVTDKSSFSGQWYFLSFKV